MLYLARALLGLVFMKDKDYSMKNENILFKIHYYIYVLPKQNNVKRIEIELRCNCRFRWFYT